MAARRRGLRRRRRGSRRATPSAFAELRAGRFGHRRPAQVVLPGLRHRRAAGPRRLDARVPSSAAARRSTTAAARRPTGGPVRAGAARPDHDDHDDHGDQLNFYKLSFEGTRRWRALKLWMTWKHLGTSGFGRLDRGQRRPRRPPRRDVARNRTTSKRCRPSRSSRSCASGTSPARRPGVPATSSTPTRIDSSRRSRPPATAG